MKNILDQFSFSEKEFLRLAQARMPYGKYKGCLLVQLPEPYVVWCANKGFPKGKLGEQLRCLYDIKVNGLEYLFDPFIPVKKKSQ